MQIGIIVTNIISTDIIIIYDNKEIMRILGQITALHQIILVSLVIQSSFLCLVLEQYAVRNLSGPSHL